MKICKECKIEKPSGEYYALKANKDGLTGKCKICIARRVRQNREENKEYYRAFERKRIDEPKRVKARKDYAKKIMTDPVLKANMMASRKKWLDRNTIKRAAHIIVGNYKRDGKLIIKDNCENCSSKDNLNGHHEDYTKPLELTTLCDKCHGLRHREINELIRNGEDWSTKGF